MKTYRKWTELTERQTRDAQKMGLFAGYTPQEIQRLSFGMEGDRVISIKDNYLLADTFPVN